MLPLENLDKKLFKDILKESKRNIHRFTSEWTDENYHDPGITFLEMFTWITEMQRYYLNRIPKNNHYKFMDLYDVNLHKQGIASAYVTFPETKKNAILPKGTKLLAEEQIFETEKTLLITDNCIEKIITFDNKEIINNTYYNFSKDIYFYFLGEVIEKKNRLYIGFSKPFLQGDIIELLFNLFSDYPVKLEGSNVYNYGVRGKWYIYSSSKLWEEIECMEDNTELFSKSGNISLKVTRDMEKGIIDSTMKEKYYWLMYEVEDYGVHVTPKLESISINTVNAINIDYKARILEMMPENGVAEIDDYLGFYGESLLQYYSKGFWIDLDNEYYSLTKDDKCKKTIVHIKENHERLRIISYDEIFKQRSIIGSSRGLPKESFQLNLKNLIPELLIIQAGKELNGQILWKDFEYVENLISIDADECKFTLDLENDMVEFGDGQRGFIPFQMEDNLRIISFATSNKERGNVKKGEIDEFFYKSEEVIDLSVTNVHSASGGKCKLNIEEGKEEVLKDFEKIHRAVTKEDYEILVKQIPGIRIAVSKAILSKEFKNSVSIVIVPYTEAEKPIPDKKLLNIVKNYLDDYRLITTKVDIIKPLYIEVSVKAIIVTEDINGFDRNKLREHLKEHLSPIAVNRINSNYKIGDTVYISEIMKIISKFEKVKNIKSLWIDGKGAGIHQDKNGNLILPQNGICCSGNIEIHLTD